MKMRDILCLIEAAGQPEYFYHVSAASNLASIKKQGLVANMPGSQPDGNYDGAWESLTGTYLTDDIDLISHMIENRDDLAAFLIAVIEVTDVAGLLPDEDIINIICSEAWDNARAPRYDYDDPDNNDRTIKAIANALSRATGAPMSEMMLRMADTWWLVYENGEEGIDENWSEMKDAFVRAHPKLKRHHDQRPHSFRFPGNIGFKGSPRIVAILAMEAGVLRRVAGKLPASVLTDISNFADTLDSYYEDGKATGRKKPTSVAMPTEEQKTEALNFAKSVFPDRPVTELKSIIDRMDMPTFEAQLAKLRSVASSQSA